MAEPRFLLIRMGSLGDIVHTLPALSSLRETFPAARIDWLAERKWLPLLQGNPDLTGVVPIESRNLASVGAAIGNLRRAGYSHAIDFQALYKSALLALASGARRRIGFDRRYAREPAAAFLYNSTVMPAGAHKVEHNLSLVEFAGARRGAVRFPLPRDAEAESRMSRRLDADGIGDFFVLCPGGGWRSKCWPAERFGELHRRLRQLLGCRGIISFGPGEEALSAAACRAAGDSQPLALPMDLNELMAVLRRARFVVAADTGPLHLAAALGTPVIGLYGPTDPARNGPYPADVAIRNVGPGENNYARGTEYSAAMLSITVDQVVEAVLRRMEKS